MRESLREITELTLSERVVFFGEQSNIIPDCQQTLEHLHRIIVAALQFIIVGQPERASKKCSFSMGHAVDGRVLRIPPDKAILHEMFLDRLNGANHAWIIRREESPPAAS